MEHTLWWEKGGTPVFEVFQIYLCSVTDCLGFFVFVSIFFLIRALTGEVVLSDA